MFKAPSLLVSFVGFGVICLGPLALGSAQSTHQVKTEIKSDFFRSTRPDKEALSYKSLPADGIFPRGRQMPLSLFSLPHNELKEAKRSGFSMTGPYYGPGEAGHIAAAGEHGLKYFFPIGGGRDELGLPLEGEPDPLSTGKLKKLVTVQIQSVLDDPATNEVVACWYLKPEELRHWKSDEMKHLRTVTEVVRKVDPLKRPVWMYEPNHRNTESLVQTGKFLGVIGKGCYLNHGKNAASYRSTPNIWIRWSIEQIVGAADTLAAKRGRRKEAPTPIAVLEMSQDPPNSNQIRKIPDWIRHDVYLSLVCGAKGITIWSSAKREGFEKSRDIFLKAYMQTIKQITGANHLDQVFLFGERRADIQIDVVDGPAKLFLPLAQGKTAEELSYPSVALLDVVYEGHRYLMVVNSAEKPVKVKLSRFPKTELRVRNLFGSRKPDLKNGSFVASLKPLDVQVWKFYE